MMANLFLLILISVFLSAVGQVILKIGVEDVGLARLSANESLSNAIIAALINPWVLLGLLTYGSAAVVWLFVLARSDVTFAYPFLGLAFVITIGLGIVVLDEHVTLLRTVGTLLVVAGLALVARS